MGKVNNIKEKRAAWVKSNPLKKWRQSWALTQGDVATAIGVSIYTIQLWEKGSGSPRPGHIQALESITQDKGFGKKLEDWRKKNPVTVAA